MRLQPFLDEIHHGISKEFPNYEYESKCNVDIGRIEFASLLEKIPLPEGMLRDKPTIWRTSVNHYFAHDSEEQIVITECEDKEGLYLKRKGPLEPLRTTVEGQEWVLKRIEQPPTLSSIQTIFRELKPFKYVGTATKQCISCDVLHLVDGRVYELALATTSHGTPTLKMTGDERGQQQFEIEYHGYLADYPRHGELHNEHDIVKGIVNILNSALKCQKAKLTPTLESKLHYVSNV